MLRADELRVKPRVGPPLPDFWPSTASIRAAIAAMDFLTADSSAACAATWASSASMRSEFEASAPGGTSGLRLARKRGTWQRGRWRFRGACGVRLAHGKEDGGGFEGHVALDSVGQEANGRRSLSQKEPRGGIARTGPSSPSRRFYRENTAERERVCFTTLNLKVSSHIRTGAVVCSLKRWQPATILRTIPLPRNHSCSELHRLVERPGHQR